ncbi:DUF6185 family protein [Streptomyces sp. 2A115]|uniref:DUF6185 family protein n=1 Tax=Streptomyces sp. 2A115 TaxID=3457439 RepID=UPI003FD2F86F
MSLALSGLGLEGTAWAQYEDCASKQLKSAKATTSVSIKHDGEDYTKADTRLVVEVPKSWRLAPDLLLNGDTERYRAAMRCVLRHPDDPYPYRDTEWRPWPPKVTIQKKSITVEHRAVTYVDAVRDRDFGPWRITVGKRLWTLHLARPPALDKAWWQEITVDLGGRAARSVSPTPTKGPVNTQLTWTQEKDAKPPDVRIQIQPPATKAQAALASERPWYLVGSLTLLSYDLLLFPVLLFLVRRLRDKPVSSSPTPEEEATRRNLFLWACLMFAAVLAFEVDDQAPRFLGDHEVFMWWPDHRVAVHLVISTLAGGCLILFGRPRRAAGAAASLAAAYIGVVASAPGWFGLPADHWLSTENVADIERFTQTWGFLWFGLACGCLIFVWMVGVTASLTRLRRAVDVQALGTAPRGDFPHWVLAVCAAVAVVLTAMSIWASQNLWKQQSWLSIGDSDDEYVRWHIAELYNNLAWLPSDLPDWFHYWIWWLSLIGALVAVLRARAEAPGASPVNPGPTELLVINVFYVAGIVPTPGWVAGFAMWLVSVPSILLALYLLLALGKPRSVLARDLIPGMPLHSVIEDSDRGWLIESARTYRDLHAQLRRLEQGQQDGIERAQLEQKLDDLHRWTPPGATVPYTGAPLPDSVDSVELALAWGPRATWWHNACRAAFFSALIALPATAVGLWVEQIRGPLWGDNFNERFGFADLLTQVIGSQAGWAGAGFVLGALWRVLPGRRGPTKALGLSLVYAAPVAGHWVLTKAFDQFFGNWALDAALTLLILTLTGVAMDIDTFRQEGHYWPTKAALLLSVYQLRTASVQLAFFVAQLVALVSIWQQLKGNDPMVLIQPKTPSETSGGGPETGSSP